jgi:hypothetical protein
MVQTIQAEIMELRRTFTHLFNRFDALADLVGVYDRQFQATLAATDNEQEIAPGLNIGVNVPVENKRAM